MHQSYSALHNSGIVGELTGREAAAAHLPPRLGWLVPLIGLLAALLYKLPLGHQIIALMVYGLIGVWGIHAAHMGRYTVWLAATLFLAGGETIFRTAFPAGYQMFYYWLIASFLVSPHDPNNARERSQRVTLAVLGALVLLIMVNTFHPEGWRGIRQWGVIFGGVWCGCALAGRVSFVQVRCVLEWALGGVGIVVAVFLTNSVFYSAGRSSGTWEGPGPTAASAGLGLLIALFLLTTHGSISNRLLSAIPAIGCLATLILTASQGAALAAAVGMIVWIVQIRSFRHMLLATLLFIAFFYAALYVDNARGGILQGRLDQAVQDGDLSTRQYLFPAILDAARDRPLLGWGSGSFGTGVGGYIAPYLYRARNIRFSDGHNTFLHILYEQGVIGLILLIIVTAMMLYRAWRLRMLISVPLLALMVFSLVMGQSAMHKQAPMFVPWFLLMVSTVQLGTKNSHERDVGTTLSTRTPSDSQGYK